MTNRNARNSATPRTATINFVREMPGAVFFGDMDAQDIAYAMRLQRIRSQFEADDGQEALWTDLSEMGFDRDTIRQCILNPAAITSCGYGAPLPLR